MIITLKRLLEWIILFIFFFLLVVLFYKMIFFFNNWLTPFDKYKEPKGRAIKVIDMSNEYGMVSSQDFIQRLKIYYLLGE
ncbi:hypothetical protein BHF71_03585 [Vulcanibacillus modesticaldus]|uniref:DUF4227 domain-containing protein n=1 Tax=Vulcanibacillus modesticaldus TaxID=337097 RepID=A0A1D2YSD1_9BACI|nr:DUF4227 family protein [Vulcanibacillus modesticaldus]OEF97230.1 hypothetical protein BHF71_03585 [Vulcanibacillus modesticaldus]